MKTRKPVRMSVWVEAVDAEQLWRAFQHLKEVLDEGLQSSSSTVSLADHPSLISLMVEREDFDIKATLSIDDL